MKATNAQTTNLSISCFKKHDRVFIDGLSKAKHLNKRIGIVQDETPKTSPKCTRYKVFLINLNQAVLIKPQNIVHANNIHEIESILRHLAKDEKCAMVSPCPGKELLSRTYCIDPDQYYHYLKEAKGKPAGCMAVYFTLKYITLISCSANISRNFKMEYDDYDGKQYVLNKLRSFPNDKTKRNRICICLLEVAFQGFERTFPTNEHMMGIIKCNDKFRIIQSFEHNFSLQQELDAREWLDVHQMKELIECIIDVVFGINQKKAMDGFHKLYRYQLNVDKQKFKSRKGTGCLGIYVLNDINIKKWIKNANVLISDILKHIKQESVKLK